MSYIRGIGFPSLEGAGGFNVPEGDSPQNMEPPFIAWSFKLLVNHTRSLASIMLDNTLMWAKEQVKPSYTRPIRRRHKLCQPYSY